MAKSQKSPLVDPYDSAVSARHPRDSRKSIKSLNCKPGGKSRKHPRWSETGSVWFHLAPFGSVWLRGGFHFSDLYGGFYSSFWVHLFFPETNIHARHPAGWFFFRASPTDRRARRASLLPPRSSQVSCNLLESLPEHDSTACAAPLLPPQPGKAPPSHATVFPVAHYEITTLPCNSGQSATRAISG